MIKFKLDAGKVNGGGAKLPPGSYRVRIEKIFDKESKRFATPGDKVIVEFDVLEVRSKTVPFKDWKGNSLDANAGDRKSYTIDMAKQDVAIGNCTALTAAVLGVDPADPAALKAAKAPDGKNMNVPDEQGYNGWAHAFAQLCSEGNPGKDTVLDVVVRAETTGNNRTIMVHTWSPVKEEAPKAA